MLKMVGGGLRIIRQENYVYFSLFIYFFSTHFACYTVTPVYCKSLYIFCVICFAFFLSGKIRILSINIEIFFLEENFVYDLVAATKF